MRSILIAIPAVLLLWAGNATAQQMVSCTDNAQGLAGDPGATFTVTCPPGCGSSTAWGTGIYSDDSSVCTAAIHSGMMPATGGALTVTIMPGQSAYPASTQNGVTTSEWGSWGRSFAVTPAMAAPPAAALNTTSMAGNFAPVAVAPGFMPDPMTVTGTSGGEVSASTLTSVNGGSCAGYVSANPDHVVTLNGPFTYLRVDAVSTDGGDTTMVIVDPNGAYWCSDDDGGYPHPRVQGAMPAGTYRVWVGSYGTGEYHPYNLSVTEFTP